jgi:hypothetical protein
MTLLPSISTELAPYHFKPEKLPAVAQKHLIRTAIVSFRQKQYEYGIIAPEAFPSVPNFTEMLGGQNLMVSEDATQNSNVLSVTLRHEILCNRLYAGLPNHSCPTIENEVLAAFEVFPNILAEIIKERLRMFTALIPFSKIDPQHPKNHLEEGIVGTWRYLENLARGKRMIIEED